MKKAYQILRIIIFRFKSDLCGLRASSLAYSSILAIVPLLAIMFGISKGFGIQRILEDTLRREFHNQEETIQYIIQFSNSLLGQTQGGVIAGIGIVTLLYTVLRLLGTIEGALNAMWGIREARPLSRQVTDFIAILFICPIFFVLSSSFAIFLSTSLESLSIAFSWIGQVTPLMLKFIGVIPYVISAMLFTFLYIFMPNTKVQIKSAILAGICAGVTFQLLQAFYISIQVAVSKYGAIYGSFAALPLFLVWMYWSWIIFLIGAEIVVIHEERFWETKLASRLHALSPFEKELILLTITKCTVDAFVQEKAAPTIEELAATCKLPMRLISQLVEELVANRILTKAQLPKKSVALFPAKNPETLRLFDVINAVKGENHLVYHEDLPLITTLEQVMNKAMDLEMANEYNPVIKNI